MSAEVKVVKVRSGQLSATRPKEDAARMEVQKVIESFLMVIATDKEAATVEWMNGDRTTKFTIRCHKSDIGRLIGIKGKTIGALRNLVNAMMGFHGMRAVVEIPYYAPDSKIVQSKAT